MFYSYFFLSNPTRDWLQYSIDLQFSEIIGRGILLKTIKSFSFSSGMK